MPGQMGNPGEYAEAARAWCDRSGFDEQATREHLLATAAVEAQLAIAAAICRLADMIAESRAEP
jgi:hypothetical protein